MQPDLSIKAFIAHLLASLVEALPWLVNPRGLGEQAMQVGAWSVAASVSLWLLTRMVARLWVAAVDVWQLGPIRAIRQWFRRRPRIKRDPYAPGPRTIEYTPGTRGLEVGFGGRVAIVDDHLSWEVNGLPEGLSMNQSSGEITGTVPNECESTIFTVTASNAAGATSTEVELGVTPTPAAEEAAAYDPDFEVKGDEPNTLQVGLDEDRLGVISVLAANRIVRRALDEHGDEQPAPSPVPYGALVSSDQYGARIKTPRLPDEGHDQWTRRHAERVHASLRGHAQAPIEWDERVPWYHREREVLENGYTVLTCGVAGCCRYPESVSLAPDAQLVCSVHKRDGAFTPKCSRPDCSKKMAHNIGGKNNYCKEHMPPLLWSHEPTTRPVKFYSGGVVQSRRGGFIGLANGGPEALVPAYEAPPERVPREYRTRVHDYSTATPWKREGQHWRQILDGHIADVKALVCALKSTDVTWDAYIPPRLRPTQEEIERWLVDDQIRPKPTPPPTQVDSPGWVKR